MSRTVGVQPLAAEKADLASHFPEAATLAQRQQTHEKKNPVFGGTPWVCANCYCRAKPFPGSLLVESEITILLGRRIHGTLPGLRSPFLSIYLPLPVPTPTFRHPSPSVPSLAAERRSRPADYGDLASDTYNLGHPSR